MKKIKYISDGTATIPVSWKLNASIADEDIPLHNAMIMGAVMARRINTMHLWDGTIAITESLNTLTIDNLTSLTISTATPTIKFEDA